MALAGELDHPGADVDPDPAAGLERREQVAGAAADLEHRGARPDDRLVHGRGSAVVAARRAATGALRRRARRRPARHDRSYGLLSRVRTTAAVPSGLGSREGRPLCSWRRDRTADWLACVGLFLLSCARRLRRPLQPRLPGRRRHLRRLRPRARPARPDPLPRLLRRVPAGRRCRCSRCPVLIWNAHYVLVFKLLMTACGVGFIALLGLGRLAGSG